ncbi:alpha/beta hydrolase [Rufibacter roseus]|uniref:Alpha/beta hydrolase n=1 Tax=Rufibacter roseus TaxID=1567108 RepID=A0ABW2DNX0_9BACT|nr:alpha/beta hydrolase [Rufibacter roseus]
MLNAHAQGTATFNSQDIELDTERGLLKGTLTLPNTPSPLKVVLIISGSGPTDRNGNNPFARNNSLQLLAHGLSDKGIATVRYDKRGVAESKAAAVTEENLRFEDYIIDAELWIRKLKKDNRFSHVLVLGHSEGSLIGMVAARKANADAFISVAGAGQPANQIIRQQLQQQPIMVSLAAAPILAKLEAGETVAEVPPMLLSLFRPSVQPYLLSWFQYDPRQEIKHLQVRSLIVQGDQDLQVPFSEAELLAAAADKSELVIIKGMNHVLKEVPTDRASNIASYSKPTLPLASELIPVISEFIKQLR